MTHSGFCFSWFGEFRYKHNRSHLSLTQCYIVNRNVRTANWALAKQDQSVFQKLVIPMHRVFQWWKYVCLMNTIIQKWVPIASKFSRTCPCVLKTNEGLLSGTPWNEFTLKPVDASSSKLSTKWSLTSLQVLNRARGVVVFPSHMPSSKAWVAQGCLQQTQNLAHYKQNASSTLTAALH